MSPYGRAVSGTNNEATGHAPVFSTPPGPRQTEPGESAVREAAAGERKGEQTVLVVNDEFEVAELMSLQLRQAGYRVLTASDGREGYGVAQVERPDLIISDVVMPRADGIELCRLIRAHPSLRTTPVLLVSALRCDSESVVEGLEAGADDYLEAPYDRTLLFSKAAQLIDREKTEVALRESEERYRLLFENNPQPMWVYDLETLRFLAVNEAAVRHYGYTREEFLAMTIKDIRPPEDVPALMRLLSAPVAGLDEAGAWRHRRKDGSLIDVEITTHQLTFAGRLAEMVLVNDVTERLKAEAALMEAEEKYRSIFENAVEGIFQTTPEGVWISANPAMAQMLGYESPREMMASVTDIERQVYVEPESRAEYRKLLEEEGVVRSFETQLLRKDGSHIWALINTRAVRDAGGRLAYYEGSVQDIAERKQVEEELRKSEERYRDLVENAHDIIYTQDLEGNYTSINSAVERVTGYTREEALGMNVKHVAAPEALEKARLMIARKLAGESVTAYEVEIMAKGGRRVRVEINSSLIIQDGAAVGIQGIARDVTERKELEEQLRQAQKMEAVGKLAGGVAHDFNNLLTVINGYSDMLLRQLRADDAARPKVEEIKRASERAANLTRQLLAFSRKQVLQPKVVDLNEIVRETEKMLRRLIGEDIELRAVPEPKIGSVIADPGQIEQVLMNLAVNARDAMPRGGKLTIGTENVCLDEEYAAHHVSVKPGRYVVLAVSDTGSGMDAGTQARIFEPFFTTKEQGKGTGLGLSTVYGIVKQSGGYIWVYSEVGRGTTFKIYLPRVDGGAQEQEKDTDAAGALGGTETILLAEDDKLVRDMTRIILSDYGYRVLAAANGAAALSLLERAEGPVHLLLTDVVMPGMSGRELADRLAGLRPGMKMLFMSGYTEDAIVHHGVLDEGINFIQKPFSPDALARKVREVLGGTA